MAQKSKFRQRFEDQIILLAVSTLFGMVMLFFTSVVGPYYTRYIQEPIDSIAAPYRGAVALQMLFIGAVLAIGFALFELRSRRRRTYALLEVMVGIFAATYASNEIFYGTSPDAQVKAVFATLAGLYIIVRGLDNLDQGTKMVRALNTLQTENVTEAREV
jgi:vacuolar-type H+-ATPase subunit I/STV1